MNYTPTETQHAQALAAILALEPVIGQLNAIEPIHKNTARADELAAPVFDRYAPLAREILRGEIEASEGDAERFAPGAVPAPPKAPSTAEDPRSRPSV